MRRDGVAVVNHSMSKENKNPFDVLGIEPTFQLDAVSLDQSYFSRQTLSHPDRFVYHTQPERQAAAVQSSELNWAYETLKNPTSRAKALLKVRGIEVEGEEGKTVQNPEILEEMLELQEAIMEAFSPHDLEQVDSQIQDRLKEVTNSFNEALNRNEDKLLSHLFLRLTYLSKLTEDIKVRRRQSSIKML